MKRFQQASETEDLLDELLEGIDLNQQAEDEEGWVIVKKEKTGNVTKVLYANGSMKFECAWSQRTSYNYSR